MTDPAPHPQHPDPATRHALNTAQATTGAETGFWDDHGRPAPWPDDIDQWTPSPAGEPTTRQPAEPPF
jgi:hypothetical protein